MKKPVAVQLPDHDYYRLDTLSSAWKCTPIDIIQYGVEGKLQLCVWASCWAVADGFRKQVNGHPSLQDDGKTLYGLIGVRIETLRILLHKQSFEPYLFCSRLDQPDWADPFAYVCFKDEQRLEISRDLLVVSRHERKRFEDSARNGMQAQSRRSITEGDASDHPRLTRSDQRHRERCRAIAEMLWAGDPTITIEDMIRRDEITVYGCEGKIYAPKTLRNWIKKLCPNRKPGRPRKKPP